MNLCMIWKKAPPYPPALSRVLCTRHRPTNPPPKRDGLCGLGGGEWFGAPDARVLPCVAALQHLWRPANANTFSKRGSCRRTQLDGQPTGLYRVRVPSIVVIQFSFRSLFEKYGTSVGRPRVLVKPNLCTVVDTELDLILFQIPLKDPPLFRSFVSLLVQCSLGVEGGEQVLSSSIRRWKSSRKPPQDWRDTVVN